MSINRTPKLVKQILLSDEHERLLAAIKSYRVDSG